MKKENNLKKEIDIVFLLDRSGSMSGLEQDTIGGYNSYIKKQKNQKTKITTILFDHDYEMITERKPIKEIKKLTEKEYFVRGSTALFDALGKSINYMDRQKKEKVIFIITTDGEENSSTEYTKEKIKELIKKHKTWEFIYIGADIDSYKEGMALGINKTNIANYQKNKKGISKMFNAVAKVSKMYGDCEEIDESWKKELEGN